RHVPVVALRVDRGAPVVAREAPRCDPTRGLADGGSIERAEGISAYGRADRALGNLLRRVPRRVIAGKSELELTERGRVRVLPPAGLVLQVLRVLPRTVIGFPLADERELATAHIERAAAGHTLPTVLPAFERDERRVEP